MTPARSCADTPLTSIADVSGECVRVNALSVRGIDHELTRRCQFNGDPEPSRGVRFEAS